MTSLTIAEYSPAALSQRSDDELLDHLRDLIATTAEHVQRLAAVWFELEKRGHDLSHLRTGIGRHLSAVALGRIAPEAVVRLAGNATAMRALTHLPIDEQRRILDVGTVAVQRYEGVVEVPIANLSPQDVARAFDPIEGRLLPPGQQRTPRQIKRRTERTRRVIVELTEAQHSRLQAEAARTNRSASALVMQCLKNENVI